MILHLKNDIDQNQASEIACQLNGVTFFDGTKHVIVNSGANKNFPEEFRPVVQDHYVFDSDIQLANRKYIEITRTIEIGDKRIGGSNDNTLLITGPCSVESSEQIEQCAQFVSGLNIGIMRAGCFKPRTSPYSFQGMGSQGLELLSRMREKYNLKIISEVRDATHVEEVIEVVDIIQIGAKAMYDHGILRTCGVANKPVLLKRGFGTTLQEFVQAAEFILSLGNPDVILCERGIRTFETKTRFTLDLCGVAYLKQHTNLPVFLDPSHAMGYAYGVPDLTRACVAMGIDGLLIESHPSPSEALSDASQQLDFNTFKTLYENLQAVAQSIGKKII